MKPTPDPDWEERRGKIEGYYRDVGKMGVNDMGKNFGTNLISTTL